MLCVGEFVSYSVTDCNRLSVTDSSTAEQTGKFCLAKKKIETYLFAHFAIILNKFSIVQHIAFFMKVLHALHAVFIAATLSNR